MAELKKKLKIIEGVELGKKTQNSEKIIKC
jgi:hypothetical protein